MSYILDALKKADAQRERDPARGIHAQPASPAAGDQGPRDGYRPWFWGASAAGVIALSWAGWYLYQDRETVAVRTAPSVAVAPAPSPLSATAAVPVVTPPTPVATAVLPPPVVVAANEPARDPRSTSQPMMRGMPQPGAVAPTMGATAGAILTAPQTPAVAPSATSTAPAMVAQAPAGAPSAAAPSAAVPGSAAAPPAAAPALVRRPAGPPAGPPAAQAPPAPIPPPRVAVIVPTAPVAGLPPDAPKLVITGGVYSTNRAHRMLIVNGQVFNEGADLGSGVTLEEVKPKAAVLGFRGARYSVSY